MAWPPSFSLPQTSDTSPPQFENRPLPLRTYSESEASDASATYNKAATHFRRKSAQSRLRLKTVPSAMDGSEVDGLPTLVEEHTPSPRQRRSDSNKLASLPESPQTPAMGGDRSPPSQSQDTDILPFDFTKIDYELDRAQSIGQGLWSAVYLAQPLIMSPSDCKRQVSTPPLSPPRPSRLPPCSVFAVKMVSRPDAKEVFLQEARTLTVLERTPDSHHHIVPFFGLDERTTSLVFEGVLGGSLESLVLRLKVMTELERHLELRGLFVKIASDLIAGLAFIHRTGFIHADIKPANVLLDITDNGEESLTIRARYIDFSASFADGGNASNAGGTWDFMAPEQLRIQKDINKPSFASDVWSLGITLLFIIAGGSPYRAACGDNLFMLREAVKSGDPLGFARMDPVVQKRMAACQDFVDCCRLALQKDKGRRMTAAAWMRWLEEEM